MRLTTAGESHGRALVGIIEGLPANLAIDVAAIDGDLKLRQGGYGRGGRQKIESDRAEILSGVRNGLTLGSPLAFMIVNADYKNWERVMGAGECDTSQRRLTAVRPGHADLTGLIKFGQTDARNILERASARPRCDDAIVAVGEYLALVEREGVCQPSWHDSSPCRC